MPATKNSTAASAPDTQAGSGPDTQAASAPGTVEELRALTLRVGQGATPISRGGKAHGVLARLVERPEEVALRTITELAQALGVSASTLTRLATRLGYSGFVDFQKVFRDALALQHRHFYGGPVERLAAPVAPVASDTGRRAPATERQPVELGVMVRLVNEAIADTQGFLAQLSAQELRPAARLLATAPRIRIHGLRQFSALAGFLAYGLALLRSGVALLDPQGSGVAEGLAQLQPGDVLVVSSVEPHTRSIVETAAAAAAAGMVVIAITDHRASPLAGCARHAFFVPQRGSFCAPSMGACVIFCEGLLSLVETELGHKAAQALKRRGRFIAELKIE